ncbi:alpha/beta fold hydrolase [Guyparkeria hydrothermalis]|uniref:alpha/beta fold hydrolase n=1 Tax=Guyparkeria hydrothermalis TaxID=923 RepID=UPI00202052C9|nr:alpha/beta fold hydrolase [Guyparkeria hydrothermalis]MCL7745331.1 alpha/beta fold hydrolase [Guyparkeria hydrothermalis]
MAAPMASRQSPRGRVGLVAGWSYPAAVFEPLRRALADHAVSAFDWVSFAAGWLGEDVVRADEPEPSVWVGWSLGGVLLLEALRQGRIAPDRLVLVNATPRFLEAPGWPGVPEAEWRGLRRAAARHPMAAVAAFRRRFALPDVAGRDPALADVSGLDWLARLDLRAFLADVSTPVECWLAQDDPLVPADWPSHLALSPRVCCQRFTEPGHAPWFADPAALAARLSAG